MRFSILAAALLTSCSEPSSPPAATGLKEELYIAADGRGRLCVFPGGKDAAIIAFARDSLVNCAAVGRIEGAGATVALIPAGEGACRIPLQIRGDTIIVGKPGPACDYYCGPGAALDGHEYRWTDNSTAETVKEPLMPTERC